MMRNYLLGVLLGVISISSFAQIENWYRSDLGRFGYKRNVLKFENVPNTGEFSPDWNNNDPLKYKGGSFDLAVDIFGKNVYFHTDATIVVDGLVSLFLAVTPKERWYDNNDYYVNRGQFFPTRLAFGNNIGKYFALYGGAQWQSLSTGIDFKNSNPEKRESLIKGNQRGFGAHAMFSYKNLLIRQSYMYDWIRSARTFNGRAITNETLIMYGKAKFGVYMNFNHMWRQKNSGYFPENYNAVFRKDLKSTYVFHEREQMTQFTLSFGVYAAGLFSGISTGISKGYSDVEVGNHNERMQKKRSTIQYKD